MRWLLFLLLVPLVHGACYKIDNSTICEETVSLKVIDNSTLSLDDDIYESKQSFYGNYIFILIAVGAIILAIIYLVKT